MTNQSSVPDDDDWKSSFDPDRIGVIYVAQAPPMTPVKIGYTLNEAGVKHRLKQLQTGNPYQIQAVGGVIGSINDERRIHSALASERLSGEWFDWSPMTITLVGRMFVSGRVSNALAMPPASRNWEDFKIVESSAGMVFGCDLSLSEARAAKTGPRYEEQQLAKGRVRRFYNVGELTRWYAANNAQLRINAHAWVMCVKDAQGQRLANLPVLEG